MNERKVSPRISDDLLLPLNNDFRQMTIDSRPIPDQLLVGEDFIAQLIDRLARDKYLLVSNQKSLARFFSMSW